MDGGMGLNVFNLVSIGVVFYGLLVALLLLTAKSPHRISNTMLAGMIAIGVWYIITSLLILTHTFTGVAYLFRIGLPFYYAIPPLLFLYVKSRTEKTFHLRRIQWWHFLPVLLAAIDLLPFYLSDEETKQAVVNRMSQDLKNVLTIRTGILPDIWHIMLRPVHGIVYVAATGIYLYRALRDKKLRKEVDTHKRLKEWLQLLTVFFGLIYFGLFLMNVIWVSFPYGSDQLLKYTTIPFFLCLIPFLLMHIFLFFNTHIIFGKLPLRARSASEPDKLPEPDDRLQLQEIEKRVLESQLFKNPKITAPEMATFLGMPPHAFSALLNAGGKKFTDFVNYHRVNYVISELEKGSNENMSIEGIATEAGFASRSTFYTAFKKITGLTPSEYIKNRV